MTGYIAWPICGHDKNHLYIIIEENSEYVFLADGDLKKTDRPKKKNKKHVQVCKQTRNIPQDLLERIREKKEFDNEEINTAIRNWKEISYVKSRCN